MLREKQLITFDHDPSFSTRPLREFIWEESANGNSIEINI